MNLLREIYLIRRILIEYPEEFILSDTYNISKHLVQEGKRTDELALKKLLIFGFYFFINIVKSFYLCFFDNIIPDNNNIGIYNKSSETELNLFFGTFNQYKALKKIIQNVEKKVNIYVTQESHLKFIEESKNINRKVIISNKRSYFIMLIFLIIRFKYIFKIFIQNDSSKFKFLISSNNKIYLILSSFINEFKTSKNKLILLSNCYNRTNICLILVCRLFNIKTVYLEHGAITDKFPPLICDYNFLDGQYSYEKYIKIENDHNINIPFKRFIFLLGKITFAKDNCLSGSVIKSNCIGFCIGLRDEISKIIMDCDLCLKYGFSISIRLHPRESKERKKIFTRYTDSRKYIKLHLALEKDISSFFDEIFCCLACSSSIQLESAIAGIPNLYRLWSWQGLEDRFEYVKNGLSIQTINEKDLIEKLNLAKKGRLIVKDELIKYYSQSFGENNFGNEHESIITNLKKIIKGETPTSLIGYKSFFLKKDSQFN